MKSLERHLRSLRERGVKALVPYFMAGVTPDWVRHVEAAIAGGANAVEIGVPFSDPMMDGVVIQEAGLRALANATTFDSLCAEVAELTVGVPLVAMSYYNVFHHYGLAASARRLADSGIEGAIVPDLAPEEAEPWRDACHALDVANVFLVAPSTPRERVTRITAMSEGFVYASARMAVTGRAADLGAAPRVVAAVREATDLPTYVGIGITTPEQAREAALMADGVIVGSALVRTILDGASPAETEKLVNGFRRALD
ncbi:MAG TPA: tryptophan synthase subunit alpha [Acidimicrobiales bacterium]|nr:tryptophan synthase subunit alpha [Acidimicrobiales bacterium]